MSDNTLLQIVTDIKSLPQKVIDTGCDLIKDLLGYPFKAAGGLAGDSIYQYQCSRRVEIAAKAKKLLDERSIAPRVLPPGFLLNYFEAVGTVDEDGELKHIWAELLASAVKSNEHARKAYVHVLKQMGPGEARVLMKSESGPQDDGDDFPHSSVPILMMLGLLEKQTLTGVMAEGIIPSPPTLIVISAFGRAFLSAVHPSD